MASSRRSGLGRGLEALIPQGEQGHKDFAMIPVSAIVANPQQPRTTFDAEALEALASSIKMVGILQPLVVRPSDDGSFVLIAGERRWRAARQLGLEEVPAVIRELDDDQSSLTQALIENIQREDLGPLEEAAAYQQLLEDFGLTHQEIGDRVGKSRSAISNALRLLLLPAAIHGLLERGELSAGHARALLGLDDRSYAEHIGRRAAEEGWSVRQVEEAVRARARAGEKGSSDRPALTEVRPVAIVELEHRLADRLGTPVSIKYRNNKGKVTISFGSLEDLERIYRTFYT